MTGIALKDAKREALIDLLKTFLPILLQLAQGLQHCHGRDVKHRDFKTENVLYFENQGRWKITDFGMANPGVAPAEETANLGTPCCQADEAKHGRYSDKTDIFSFGRVYYELVAGKLPKGGRTSWFKEKVFEVAIFGIMLKDSIARMVALDPDERPDAAALVSEIRHHISFVEGASLG